jgi:hypothetical protein
VTTEGEYVRVYHAIVDDPKFADVFDSDAALATWLRLLIVADQAWPASAHLPGNVKRRTFDLLVRVGLVDALPGWRYRIHGLDSERGARSDKARNAAAKRWHSGSSATASDVPMPSKAEQEQEQEQSKADDGRADLEAFLSVRYRPPTPAQRTLMDAYVQVFDVTGPARAARLILSNPDDPIGALKADLAAFRAERAEAARKSEEPKPAPRRPARGLTGVNAELAAMLREQDAKGAA